MSKQFYTMVVFGIEDTNKKQTKYTMYSLAPYGDTIVICDPDKTEKAFMPTDNYVITSQCYSDIGRQTLLTIRNVKTGEKIQRRLMCNIPDPHFQEIKVPLAPAKNLVMLGGVVLIDKNNKSEAKKILAQLHVDASDLFSELFEPER